MTMVEQNGPERPVKKILSARLQLCAQMVPQGSKVADVGCDHGYLSIFLLRSGIAAQVVAADLRPMPLNAARRNAKRFGVADQIRFVLGDGLKPVEKGEVDCVVCAGMGGDTIAGILAACPWVKSDACTLVLQPQSSGNDLRRWLGENRYIIERELPVLDGGRLYTAMKVRYGGGTPVSPGHEYASQALLDGGGALVGDYLRRISVSLKKNIEGLQKSQLEDRRAQLPFYETALREIEEMREAHDYSETDT